MWPTAATAVVAVALLLLLYLFARPKKSKMVSPLPPTLGVRASVKLTGANSLDVCTAVCEKSKTHPWFSDVWWSVPNECECSQTRCRAFNQSDWLSPGQAASPAALTKQVSAFCGDMNRTLRGPVMTYKPPGGSTGVKFSCCA